MRGSRETADPKTPAHPLHAAALVCAIATPLVLAAVLEREPGSSGSAIAAARPAPSEIAPAASARPVPAASLPAPRPEIPARPPEPATEAPTPVDLAQRARGDARRLRDAGRFTLQFAVMCKDDNVRQILGELAADPRLYLVRASIDGRACHRVCYGAYRTADEAQGERTFPSALSGLTTAPRPVSVGQVAP